MWCSCSTLSHRDNKQITRAFCVFYNQLAVLKWCKYILVYILPEWTGLDNEAQSTTGEFFGLISASPSQAKVVAAEGPSPDIARTSCDAVS